MAPNTPDEIKDDIGLDFDDDDSAPAPTPVFPDMIPVRPDGTDPERDVFWVDPSSAVRDDSDADVDADATDDSDADDPLDSIRAHEDKTDKARKSTRTRLLIVTGLLIAIVGGIVWKEKEIKAYGDELKAKIAQLLNPGEQPAPVELPEVPGLTTDCVVDVTNEKIRATCAFDEADSLHLVLADPQPTDGTVQVVAQGVLDGKDVDCVIPAFPRTEGRAFKGKAPCIEVAAQ